MQKMLIAFALMALAAGAGFGQDKTAAADKTAVMKPVQQFTDAFNKGDAKTAAAACADQTSIIDEFPPYEWHGAGGCAKWMNDFDADSKKNGITDGSVKLGPARHVEVMGDRAYVVVPAEYSFKQKGNAMKESGSTLTVALRKGANGWRMTAWTWTKNELK
ncbi:MAG: nuclear transport factor 2 family protein [Terriglobales bacterium]